MWAVEGRRLKKLSTSFPVNTIKAFVAIHSDISCQWWEIDTYLDSVFLYIT